MENLDTDYYKALEIKPSAEFEDIRKSYQRLALKYYPDKKEDGSNKFQQCQKAYDVLGDQNQRTAYDQKRHNQIKVKLAPFGVYKGNVADVKIVEEEHPHRSVGTRYLEFIFLPTENNKKDALRVSESSLQELGLSFEGVEDYFKNRHLPKQAGGEAETGNRLSSLPIEILQSLPLNPKDVARLAATSRDMHEKSQSTAFYVSALDTLRNELSDFDYYYILSGYLSRLRTTAAPSSHPLIRAIFARSTAAEIPDDEYRSKVLVALAPSATEGERAMLFARSTAAEMGYDPGRSDVLVALVPGATEAERVELFARSTPAEMGDDAARSWLLVALVPGTREAERAELFARSTAAEMPNHRARSKVLVALVPGATEEEERAELFARSTAAEMYTDWARSEVLVALVPGATEEERVELFARSTAAEFRDSWARAFVLVALARGATEAERPELFARSTAAEMGHTWARSEVLVALVPGATEAERVELFARSTPAEMGDDAARNAVRVTLAQEARGGERGTFKLNNQNRQQRPVDGATALQTVVNVQPGLHPGPLAVAGGGQQAQSQNQGQQGQRRSSSVNSQDHSCCPCR